MFKCVIKSGKMHDPQVCCVGVEYGVRVAIQFCGPRIPVAVCGRQGIRIYILFVVIFHLGFDQRDDLGFTQVALIRADLDTITFPYTGYQFDTVQRGELFGGIFSHGCT